MLFLFLTLHCPTIKLGGTLPQRKLHWNALRVVKTTGSKYEKIGIPSTVDKKSLNDILIKTFYLICLNICVW